MKGKMSVLYIHFYCVFLIVNFYFNTEHISVVEKLSSALKTPYFKFKCLYPKQIYYHFNFLVLMAINSSIIFSKSASLLVSFSVERIAVFDNVSCLSDCLKKLFNEFQLIPYLLKILALCSSGIFTFFLVL